MSWYHIYLFIYLLYIYKYILRKETAFVCNAYTSEKKNFFILYEIFYNKKKIYAYIHNFFLVYIFIYIVIILLLFLLYLYLLLII